MNRREFLGAMAAAPIALSGSEARQVSKRTYEVRTHVELTGATGPAKVWVPVPAMRQTAFQSLVGGISSGRNTAKPREGTAGVPGANASAATAEWDDPVETPFLTVTFAVRTTDYRVALTPGESIPHPANLDRYLRPTRLIPTDGIVKETADAITKPHRTPLARARAIYDWIVENTVRDPQVKGCGLGDIRWMLESRNLAGKCADLNALFVGLCRAAGMPARDLYGLRLAPSQQFPSLGRAGGDVTTAQHCRAEVWISNIGWVPVDPADVRKLILEEKQPSLTDPYVAKVREALFGSWEMNWVAFNDLHDVTLPGSTGKPLPFFMYPHAEVKGVSRDSLDPQSFRYTITAREV
jgi:transglutaminase-like putative cysteine protease